MILKKIGMVGVVAGLATTAFAQEKSDKLVNITAKVRMDAMQSKAKVGSGDEVSLVEGFKMRNADLKIEGMVPSANTSYLLYLKPLSIGGVANNYATDAKSGLEKGSYEGGNTPGNDTDGATRVIAEATITHKLMKMVSLRMGRMGTNAGSVENTLYGSFEGYFWSYHSGLAEVDNVGSGVEVNVMPLGNDDHAVRVQVVNGIKNANIDPKGGMTTMLMYEGNINKMIHPIVTVGLHSYSKAKKIVGNTETIYNKTSATSIGLGAQLTIADLTADIEYNMINRAKATTKTYGNPTDGEVKAQTYSGAILHVAYELKAVGLKPWIKFTTENEKYGADQGAGDITYSLIGVGAEYWANKNLNYHFAYGSANETKKKGNVADGGDLKTVSTTVLLGAGVKI